MWGTSTWLLEATIRFWAKSLSMGWGLAWGHWPTPLGMWGWAAAPAKPLAAAAAAASAPSLVHKAAMLCVSCVSMGVRGRAQSIVCGSCRLTLCTLPACHPSKPCGAYQLSALPACLSVSCPCGCSCAWLCSGQPCAALPTARAPHSPHSAGAVSANFEATLKRLCVLSVCALLRRPSRAQAWPSVGTLFRTSYHSAPQLQAPQTA